MSRLPQRIARKATRTIKQRVSFGPLETRAAIIGCGRIAVDHFASLERRLLVRVAAVQDSSVAALAAAKSQWPGVRVFRDLDRMLQTVRPSVVSVCTWPESHAEIVVAAAHAGVKAILCEKPLALRMDHIALMQSACVETEVRLAGGHQYRFHPAFRAARQVLKEGTVGKVQDASGNIVSSLANNGPHLIDTIRFLLDDENVVEVSAKCERVKDEMDRGLRVETSAMGEIVFANGIRCSVRTGDLSPFFFGISITGSRGTMSVTPGQVELNGKIIREWDCSRAMDECRKHQFSEFLQWSHGRREGYSADAQNSARTAEVVLALYESARLGVPVALPLRNSGDIIRQLYGSDGQSDPLRSDHTRAPSRLSSNPGLALDGGESSIKRWPATVPKVGLRELRALARVIRSKRLCSVDGSEARKLESEFAMLYGANSAVASTSGTAALHTALSAIDPEPGDEVITTPMSDMGTVIPILACNCVPVFADIDSLSGNLTRETIAAKISPRTRAVIVVHLFGRPASLGPILDLLRPLGIPVIEDCAQAHLAVYRGRLIGTNGDFGCFSFQQSKQITCGDGGITLVNSAEYVQRARMFVDKGWNRSSGARAHEFLGMNYRMTELQASVARVQLSRLPGLIDRRRQSADALCLDLEAIPGIRVPAVDSGSLSAWWMFNFALDEKLLKLNPDEFVAALNAEGIPARRNYLPRPLFNEELFVRRRTYGSSGYPLQATCQQQSVSDFSGLSEFFERQVIIPWNSDITLRHAKQSIKGVKKILSACELFESGDREGHIGSLVQI